MFRPYSLDALKAFESAARHLSFSKAANELNVTPGAVSQRIKLLEEQLGVHLFHRLNPGLALTEAAQRGMPGIRAGLRRLSDSVALIQQRGQTKGLSVWLPPSFASKWLMPRLPQYSSLYPQNDMQLSARVEMVGGAVENLVISADFLRQNEIDVAVCFGAGNHPGCHVDHLFDVTAVTLCSPDLTRGREHPLCKPTDLQFHTLLHDETPYDGRLDWATWLRLFDLTDVIDATHGVRFNSVSLALQAAVDGQGVVLSMRTLALSDLQSGRLIVPFDSDVRLTSAYYMVCLPEKVQQPEVVALSKWLLAQARTDTQSIDDAVRFVA